jgi:hypothetical protein
MAVSKERPTILTVQVSSASGGIDDEHALRRGGSMHVSAPTDRVFLLLKPAGVYTTAHHRYARNPTTMPKYVIEREIPGAGALTTDQLQAISQKSCGVLQNLGPRIQWLHSYVTDDKIYCVYIAPNEAAVREHAQQGGFPANKISEVKSIIDPTTAEV